MLKSTLGFDIAFVNYLDRRACPEFRGICFSAEWFRLNLILLLIMLILVCWYI